VLKADQRDEFDRVGLLRLSAAIAASEAEAMCVRVWADLEKRHGVRRGACETWPRAQATGFQSLNRSGAFSAMANPVVMGVLDDLLGDGGWRAPKRWGLALVTFPNAEVWDVPHRSWHFDFMAPAAAATLPGIRIFGFLNHVLPGGGGTLGVAGSHRLVRDRSACGEASDEGHSAELRKTLMREEPWLRALCSPGGGDRVQRFMHEGAVRAGVELRVVEMTGAPGDVIVMHPWLLHAAAPNCRDQPRIMVGQAIF